MTWGFQRRDVAEDCWRLDHGLEVEDEEEVLDYLQALEDDGEAGTVISLRFDEEEIPWET